MSQKPASQKVFKTSLEDMLRSVNEWIGKGDNDLSQERIVLLYSNIRGFRFIGEEGGKALFVEDEAGTQPEIPDVVLIEIG